jgi:hypothetical protein
LLLTIAGICLAQPALAVEKYAAVPLPDERLGSKALGLTKVGVGTVGVVGSQQKSDGTVGAMFWSIAVDPSDPSGNTVYATELPKPPDRNAEATGLAFIEQGNLYNLAISGNTFSPSGGSRATIWTRDTSGQFAGTILDDEAAASAITTRNTPLGLIIVVCGKFRLANGNWHACVWEITGQGMRRTDLGALTGGPNSEAMAVLYVGGQGGVLCVVGSAQRPDGRWIAASWVATLTGNQGLDWFLFALPTPPGAESRAHFIGTNNGGVWRIAGEVTAQNGSRSASTWMSQGPTPNEFFLDGLYRDALGRNNSAANGIVFNGGDGNDTFVVGSAWNTESDQTGMGVLSNGLNAQNPLIIPFEALRSSDPVLGWNVVALEAAAMGGVIAGEGRLTGSMTPQAMLFLPTNREVPQVLLAGTFGRGSFFDGVANTWQEDGSELSILPRRDGRVDSILIDFASAGFSAATSRTPRSLTLVSRVMPARPNAAAPVMLTLQLYDSIFAVWVTVGVREEPSDGVFHRLMFDISSPERFAVPGGQPLRWRIGLRGEDWRDWGLDLIEMRVEKLP